MKLVVVLEGGPGVGKTSVATYLRKELPRRGVSVCVVDDGVRLFAPILAKLFGKWFEAPRDMIEYMLLGWQLAKFVECLDSDVVVMDYGPEAPLGFMEADSVHYPRELEGLANALLEGVKSLLVILEPPAGYARDSVRWEDPKRADKYRRALIVRTLSLVPRIKAKALVVPEKDSVSERAKIVLEEVLNELGEGGKG